MSLIIGGINLFDQGLNNEYRIMILEKIIDRLLSNSVVSPITQEEVDTIKSQCLVALQKKYPEAGITERSSK